MRYERQMLEELTSQESMRLLGSVSLGRIIFTAQALPAVCLASHVVDGDHVVIRAGSSLPITSKLTTKTGTVVAYEADAVDPADHLGWSVTVVGWAYQVTDPDAIAAFRRALRPWADEEKDQVISIHVRMVTGFRLCSAARPGSVGTTTPVRPRGDLVQPAE
jgi:hypothetical protein